MFDGIEDDIESRVPTNQNVLVSREDYAARFRISETSSRSLKHKIGRREIQKTEVRLRPPPNAPGASESNELLTAMDGGVIA
jgi:hypothetical protein